ncbi:unnamed protein product [Ilex paraguariensis]|uniref:Zasp-like motif domain-containing protein n=1 Tax=Ilex paraguariensis TaxID=185542 RepID=A0ABC8RJ88_9AQUA
MAGYGYQRGGYTTRNGWDTRTDDWSQKNYSGNANSDHVHHPVIVDAQGRERPISESYATQTEKIIECVQVPVVTEYKYISPTEVESFKNYRVENDRWQWPKSTPVVQDRPQKVEVHVQTPAPTEYTYSSPTKVEPFKEYRVNNNNKLLGRPQKVEEFVTKIQTDVSQPTRPDSSPTYWRDTPNSIGYNGNAGYGGYKNFNNREKPDDYYCSRNDTFTDPNLNNRDGQDRPDSKGWAMQPPSPPLSKPTNDIGTAVEFLKGAITTLTQPRFGIPVSAMPKKDPYTETIGVEYPHPQKAVKPATVTFTAPPPSIVPQKEPYGDIIDSREATRRYGNSNNSSAMPYKREESYTGVIDSREAVKRYGGTYV